MELRAPRQLADTERLVGHQVTRDEQRRSLWEIERVPVPLEREVPVREVGEESIVDSIVGRMDRFEADLASRPLADLRVERPGEELSSETDAEERDPTVERLPDQVGGFLDERLLVGVLDVERGTEDDDPVDVVERGSRVSCRRARSTRGPSAPALSTAAGATPNVSDASHRTKRMTVIGAECI